MMLLKNMLKFPSKNNMFKFVYKREICIPSKKEEERFVLINTLVDN